MKLTVNVPTEIEVDSIRCVLPVRYGEDDMPKDFPFRSGDLWTVIIDLDTGKIRDWPAGRAENVHMKVTDMGCYYLMFGDKVVKEQEQEYVPCFFPGRHYRDYIMFEIFEDGTISGWDPGKSDGIEGAFFGKND